MTTVRKNGKQVASSKNLRGLLVYASKHGVDRVTIAPVEGLRQGSEIGGLLLVDYSDDAQGQASFASFSVLQDWVKARRSWPEANKVTESVAISCHQL